MFGIIIIMFCGIAAGYLLRRMRGIGRVSLTTMITIVLLLFLMGCEIGADDNVMRNLTSLGGEALLIASAGVLGSVVAARMVYAALYGKRGGGDEE